jgi:hypothetical protein
MGGNYTRDVKRIGASQWQGERGVSTPGVSSDGGRNRPSWPARSGVAFAGGRGGKGADEPHGRHSPGAALRRKNAAAYGLPQSSDEERPMPDARRHEHGPADA